MRTLPGHEDVDFLFGACACDAHKLVQLLGDVVNVCFHPQAHVRRNLAVQNRNKSSVSKETNRPF